MERHGTMYALCLHFLIVSLFLLSVRHFWNTGCVTVAVGVNKLGEGGATPALLFYTSRRLISTFLCWSYTIMRKCKLYRNFERARCSKLKRDTWNKILNTIHLHTVIYSNPLFGEVGLPYSSSVFPSLVCCFILSLSICVCLYTGCDLLFSLCLLFNQCTCRRSPNQLNKPPQHTVKLKLFTQEAAG